MRRRAVVQWRRNLAPVDFQQIGLNHFTFLKAANSEWRIEAELAEDFPICHSLFPLPVYPLARRRRPFSRPQSRFFSLSRLSCSFLPFATASSSLARPRSLK